MEITLGIMLYLSILFTGEEYHIDYVLDAEQQYYTAIQQVQNDPAQMEVVNNQYVPEVDNLVIYEYDDSGSVVIIDPREMK